MVPERRMGSQRGDEGPWGQRPALGDTGQRVQAVSVTDADLWRMSATELAEAMAACALVFGFLAVRYFRWE